MTHVFKTLATHSCRAKYSNCTFAAPEIPYLGKLISATEFRADSEKLDAIQSWPAPTSTTTLRSFLVLTGYYYCFVKNYATVATPLMDLLKAKTFQWTPQAQTAFLTIKAAMSTLIQPALPDFSLPFDVTTDASGTAIRAVLAQKDKLIAFFSKKLSSRMQSSSTYVFSLNADLSKNGALVTRS